MAALTGVKVIDMVGGEVSKISYNGEEYAKVSEREDGIHANPGDILLRINHAEDYARIGDYFVVNSDRRIVDRVDDEIRPHLKHYAIFEKVLAESDAKLAELESRIAALEAAQPSAQQTPQSEQFRKVTGRSPQVGDYVKYDEAPSSYVKAGKYYEIIEIDSSNDPHILDEDGDDWDTVNDSSFEVYEKIDQLTQTDAQQPESQPLKVGDKVRLLSGGYRDQLHGFTDGKIYEVRDNGSQQRGGFKIKIYGGGCGSVHGYAKPDQIEKVSAEEAQQIEADRAIAAKFAEIGRKPGEFKAGDIVKVTDTLCTTYLTVGQVTEIIDFGYGEIPKVRSNDGGTRNAKVELITPVERRFDLSE